MKTKLEDPVALTKEIVREYCRGNTEPWFRRLCPKSVWVGTGERSIFGGDAIRKHFGSKERLRVFRILREEYFHLPVNARSAIGVAHVAVGDPKSEAAHIEVSGTLFYQLSGGETKVLLTHAGQGSLRSFKPDRDSPLTWVPTCHLYRDLLLDMPEAGRIAVPSGGRTFYIHPNVILYVQSKERRAELSCVDSVVRSDLSDRTDERLAAGRVLPDPPPLYGGSALCVRHPALQGDDGHRRDAPGPRGGI